jgi:plastocyanin
VSVLRWPTAFYASAVCCWQVATAAQLSLTLTDSAGAPIGGAVVALQATMAAAAPAPAGRPVALDQVNKQFVPHVLAIQTGTTLVFPNSDNIRHQVYSFSDAKRFELKLYSGKSAAPVLFDRAGVVVLGCNIHDWMSAYLYVLDTPFFTLTDKGGSAVLRAPAGAYTLKIWHPRYARGRESFDARLQLIGDSDALQQSLVLSAADDSDGRPPPP